MCCVQCANKAGYATFNTKLDTNDVRPRQGRCLPTGHMLQCLQTHDVHERRESHTRHTCTARKRDRNRERKRERETEIEREVRERERERDKHTHRERDRMCVCV